MRRIIEPVKGFNLSVKEQELKKNIEIEIEKEFLTKYLESESEGDEEDFDDDDEELDEVQILQTIEDVDNS